MGEVDIFAENCTLIDWELHDLWIEGRSGTEAVTLLRERGLLREYPGVTQALLVSDVNDHYRLFAMLENLLLTVGNFSEQLLYQMDAATQQRWIERYMSLDAAFCRELLGKKLNSRLRRDLDEIAEKTGVHLKSCRRQFDSIKRVFKALDDLPGTYVSNVQRLFHVSQSLAEQYATIIFVSTCRFEMGKKKLHSLTFDAIKTVCLMLMDCWMDTASATMTTTASAGSLSVPTTPAMSTAGGDDDGEVAAGEPPGLDKEFLLSLKELKPLQDRDKEHRNVVCSRLKDLSSATPSTPPEAFSAKSFSEVEANFKLLTRNVLGLAQAMSSSKELRDFFVFLVEKIVEPLRQMRLNRLEVDVFLRVYTEAVTSNALLVEDGVKSTFQRFMTPLAPCILAVL